MKTNDVFDFTEQIYSALKDFICVGLREIDVVDFIIRSGHIAFYPLVAFGENTREIHNEPATNRQLRKGDLVLIDFGFKINDQCSDITRMLYCGRFIPAKYREKFNFLKTVKRTLLEDTAEKIWNTVLPDCNHRLNHGITNIVHDTYDNEIIAVEPGYYCENWGMRLEDNYYMKSALTKEQEFIDKISHMK